MAKRNAAGKSWMLTLAAGVIAMAALIVIVLVMHQSGSPSSPASTTGKPPAPAATATTASPVTPAAVEPAPAPPATAHVHLAAAGRSPMPQPGETFDALIAAPRFDAKPVAIAPDPADTSDEEPVESDPDNTEPNPDQPAKKPAPRRPANSKVIPWEEAGRYVDQEIIAEGVVVETHNTGEVCFLNFVHGRRDVFYIIIFQDQLGSWPQPPERWFLNKTIRASGKVYTHKGRPQIRIEKASQLTIVE